MNRTFFQAPMLGQVGPHMFSCMPFGEMYFFGGSAVQSGLMTHGLYPVVQNVGTTPVTPVGNGDIYLGGKTASKVHQAIPVVLPAHLRMLAMPEGSNDLPLALDFIVPDDPEIFFRTFLPNASDKQFQKDHLDKALNVGRLLGSETLVYLLGLGKKMEGYEQLKGLIDTRIMSDLYLLGKRLERIESTPYMELVRRHIGEHVAAGTADINVFLNIADNLPHLLADIKFVETFGYDACANASEVFYRDVGAFTDQIFKLDELGLLKAIGLDRIIESGATRTDLLANFSKLAQYAPDIAALPDDKKDFILAQRACSMRTIALMSDYEMISLYGFEGYVDLLPLLSSTDVRSARTLLETLGVVDEAVVEKWITLFDGQSYGNYNDQLMEVRFIITASDNSSLSMMTSYIDSDSDPAVILMRLKNHRLLEELSRYYGVSLDDKHLIEYAINLSKDEMSIAHRNTLGALSMEDAFKAVIYRFQQLESWFGTTAVHRMKRVMPNYEIRAPLAVFNINDRYKLHLELGNYEAYTGLQFAIYHQSDDGWSVPYYKKGHLAAVGFVETEDGIAITRLQGGKDLGSKLDEFKKYSGGTSPIVWLAYAVGQALSARAAAEGKEFKLLNGKHALYLYPHKTGKNPEGIAGIQDALAYIGDKPKSDDRSEAGDKKLREHRRVVNSIGLYNSTAKRLGFRKGVGDDESGINPWYVFDVSRRSAFGEKFMFQLDRRGDVEAFQSSIAQFMAALRSVQVSSLDEYDPEWVNKQEMRFLEQSENPFPNYFGID